MKKIYSISVALGLSSLAGWALANTEDQVKVLDEINAAGNVVEVSKERKEREQIDKEMINDVRDLVRYSTDVGIVDSGRHLKGFAMRGVEGNRVGISIDGVSLPEFEENSLYARYGNFNNSRMAIDPELVNQIDVLKGGSSFELGSGFLGGGINYRTLSAQDFVKDGQSFGALFRTGYASKNREWYNTLGLGYIGEKFDITALYSVRRGHEMKSNGDVNMPLSKGDPYATSSRQIPDPSKHTYHNYLVKFNYIFNPAHKMGFSLTGQEGSRFTNEYSYHLFGSQWRDADDKTRRNNFNIFYHWTPESEWLASVKLDLDYQQTKLGAINYKGGEDWRTGKRRLDEIYDRSMETTYKRAMLSLETLPLTWGSIAHQFAFRTHVSERYFENLNKDRGGIGASYEYLNRYTIQYPMKTTNIGFSLSDNIQWSERFSSTIGLRYDIEKVKPSNLNANCSTACLAEGKPAGNTFRNWSGLLNFNYQVNDTWTLAYQISSGYRVPTASEMYFTFTSPYGTWQSNPNLKAERSINQTFSIAGTNDIGMMDFSFYQSRYKNFLHEQESIITTPNPYYSSCAWYGCSQYYQTPKQQMVNLDSARLRGIEFKGRLNLDRVINAPSGMSLIGSVGYSKGKLSNGTSLLSIQPIKVMLGLDYEDPDGRWGLFSRLTYLGGKKAKDAKVHTITGTRSNLRQEIITYPYLNKSAWVFDMFGYYRPVKDLTIRAGVYNIFNRQYHTWDALRGINGNSTTNSIDRNGYGLQRYYAPGRNFAVALEYKF